MSNVHKNIDDSNLHVAKGFVNGSPGQSLWKNERSLQTFANVNILPPGLSKVNSSTDVVSAGDGDIYLLDNARGTQDVDRIEWQSVNTVRYYFNGSPDLTDWAIADYVLFSLATNTLHNGSFVITGVNTGSFWIEISNPEITDNTNDEATDSPCIATSTRSSWNGCPVNSWARLNMTEGFWFSINPWPGAICYLQTDGIYFMFNGIEWQSMNNATGGVVLLHNDVATNSTTAITTEEVLKTFDIPANTLTKDGQRIKIRAIFQNANNANTKTSSLAIFGQKYSVVSTGASEKIVFEMCVERKSFALCTISGISFSNTSTIRLSLGITANWTVANTIRATGVNGVASAGDINNYQLEIEVIK